MKKVTCPCCEGTGKIELTADLPTTLTKRQTAIYRAIKAKPYTFGANELAAILYSDDPNGGPLDPLATIHSTISQMNNRLAAVGQRVCANHRGQGATYNVVNLNVV